MIRQVELLTPLGAATSVNATVDDDGAWLDAEGLKATIGFELKPEGLCRDETCFPLPPGREAEFARDGRVNVAAFWRHRGGAVAHSADGEVWVLGDPIDEYANRLQSLSAPDFTLPDANGTEHSLSDYRGHKVLLATWASWCGCREDLKAWNRLVEEVGDENLKVIAVALDSAPGAAEPWIEKAAPVYPALIDREHHIAELYDLVNVPQAVWIDEEGRIVRPPEPAGAFDFLNKRVVDGPEASTDPAEQARVTRRHYLEALKDWVANGEDSAYVYSEAEARERLHVPEPAVLEAHVNFRLGQHLIALGQAEEGNAFVERAKELHPDSWAMFREAATKVESGPMEGLAAGPDFMERLTERARAGKPYYPPIEMEGMPS